jgi:hypothetical protein
LNAINALLLSKEIRQVIDASVRATGLINRLASGIA